METALNMTNSRKRCKRQGKPENGNMKWKTSSTDPFQTNTTEREGKNMKLFKSVDDKLEAIGFKKIEESEDIVVYKRQQPEFVQILELSHRGKGQNTMHSYQMGVNSDGYYNSVGLTAYEAHLASKKMWQKDW